MPMMLERIDNGNEYEVGEWVRFGLRLGVTTALHPFEYAKVLMQVGYPDKILMISDVWLIMV